MFVTQNHKNDNPFKERLFSAIAQTIRFSVYYGKYIASPPEERLKITVKHGI